MKKSILILAIVFAINTLTAQTNNVLPTGVQVTPEGINVPVIVTNKFSIDYPNINPIWKMSNDNYAAEYTDITTNLKHVIIYDEDGTLLQNDREIIQPSYPKKIDEYYGKNYPNEKYVVWVSEYNVGEKVYYTKRKSSTLYFDSNGKYTSTKNSQVTKK